MAESPPRWKRVRLILPGMVAVLVIVATSVADDRNDISYGAWALTMIAAPALCLGTVRVVEPMRVWPVT